LKKFWFITYNLLFLPFFWVAARTLSILNNKIRIGFGQRKGLFENLQSALGTFEPSKKIILIHCSSLGEFEQAKPIIEELDRTSAYNFIISFFSPSGFNHSKLDFISNSNIAKTYVPFDWFYRSGRFLDVIEPDAAVFIKYDLWFNLLYNLASRGIFRLLANASYEEKALKWKFFPSKEYRKLIYNFFNTVCCTDSDDQKHFKELLSDKVEIHVYGDTKYERAGEAKEIAKSKTLIKNDILVNKNVFVVGSSWDTDNEILLPVLDRLNSSKNGVLKPLLTLLAPHEPTESNIQEIERVISENFSNLKPIRYSRLEGFTDENLILVDCVGILVSLYKYADIAYVGGGLQAGLHNVLEPAVFSIPVLFGDDKISEDGEMLLQTGGGIAVNNSKALFKTLTNLLKENNTRIELGRKSYSMFEKKNNTSSQIARLINKKLK